MRDGSGTMCHVPDDLPATDHDDVAGQLGAQREPGEP